MVSEGDEGKLSICKNCGHENMESNKFCGECGAGLSSMEPEKEIEEVNSIPNEEESSDANLSTVSGDDNNTGESQNIINNENIITKPKSKIKQIFSIRRNQYIACAAIIILLFVAIIGNMQYKNYKFNQYVLAADNQFNNEEYKEAGDLYSIALEYKSDEDIKDKLSRSIVLNSSRIYFNLGDTYFDQKEYRKAYDEYEQVNKIDTDNYASAIKKMVECSRLFIDGKLEEAKDSASERDYVNAISCLNEVVNFDSTNETAITLRAKYISEKETYEKQKEIDDARSKIRIISLYTSNPNSAGGVDLHIIFRNNSAKSIKYITFEVIPYNAVGDAQYCEIRDYSNYRGQVTGPINPGATYGYGYLWECAWYNNTIVKAKLISVNITYTDSSNASLNETQCQYVIY